PVAAALPPLDAALDLRAHVVRAGERADSDRAAVRKGFHALFLHRGETGEGLDDEPADGREVVAALLDDHRRQPQRAEDPSGFAITGRGHFEWALRVAGRGVDAERDDERTRRGCERRGTADRGEPAVVARAGREREVEVRRVVLRLEAEE